MLEAVLAGLFGLIIGSFLNVCIYRMPRDLSIVTPRSFCPECEKQVAWYDNIPVVSYVILRGRCRHCGKPIALRYLLVELLTAVGFFFLVVKYGPTLIALKFCVFTALVIGLIFADFETMILPDEFTWGGVVLALIFATFVPARDHYLDWILSTRFHGIPLSLIETAIGAIVPSLFLWALGALFLFLRKKEGLGLGDVKMIAMVGAFTGLSGAVVTVMIGSILGSVIGLIYIYATGKDAGSYELPFGSFLGMAALAVPYLVPALT